MCYGQYQYPRWSPRRLLVLGPFGEGLLGFIALLGPMDDCIRIRRCCRGCLELVHDSGIAGKAWYIIQQLAGCHGLSVQHRSIQLCTPIDASLVKFIKMSS